MILNTRITRGLALGLSALLLSPFATAAAEAPLPHPEKFEPARYLGFWHEIARLPAPFQPDDTLATAEYRSAGPEGRITVKNTNYDKEGQVISTIDGQADLVAGNPPGRLSVRFGPMPAGAPNYYVIHVDKEYRYAVVGVPSRKSLWILSRDVPVSKEQLDELVGIAKKAGFDTTKLIVAPWKKPVAPAAKPSEKK
jgi:apolipoprotein D and lipocalin family protein